MDMDPALIQPAVDMAPSLIQPAADMDPALIQHAADSDLLQIPAKHLRKVYRKWMT